MLRFRPSEIALTPAEIHQAKERMLAKQARQNTSVPYARNCSLRLQDGGPRVQRGPERSRDESMVYTHPYTHTVPHRVSQTSDNSMLDLHFTGPRERYDFAISSSFEHSGNETEDYSADDSETERAFDSFEDENDAIQYSPHKHELGFSGFASTPPWTSEDSGNVPENQFSLDGASDQARIVHPSSATAPFGRIQSVRNQHTLPGSPLRLSEAFTSSSPRVHVPTSAPTPPLGRLRGYRHRSETYSYQESVARPFAVHEQQDIQYMRAPLDSSSSSRLPNTELDPRAAEFKPSPCHSHSSSLSRGSGLRDITAHSGPNSTAVLRNYPPASTPRPETHSGSSTMLPAMHYTSGILSADFTEALSAYPAYPSGWRASRRSQSRSSSSNVPLTSAQVDGAFPWRHLLHRISHPASGHSILNGPTPPLRSSSIAFSERALNTGVHTGAAAEAVSSTAVEEALRGRSSPLDRVREEALLRLQAFSITDTPVHSMPVSRAHTRPSTPPPQGTTTHSASEGRITMRTYNDHLETNTPPRTPTRRPHVPLLDNSLTAPPAMRRRRERPTRLRRASRTPIWPTSSDAGLPPYPARTGPSMCQRRRPVEDDGENWHTTQGLQEARRIWMARSERQAVMDSTPPRLTNFERFL